MAGITGVAQTRTRPELRRMRTGRLTRSRSSAMPVAAPSDSATLTSVKMIEISVIFTLVNVALSLGAATGIALLLERVSRPVRILLSSGLVLVWATPVIPAINLWQWMFDYEFGVVNWLLTWFHVGNYLHHNWFENPLQGFTVITVIVVWGAIPFLALMLYAGLTQV